jgi:hypothetical protein
MTQQKQGERFEKINKIISSKRGLMVFLIMLQGELIMIIPSSLDRKSVV